MKSVGIRCVGKVQGVFFRASTRQEAENLGVLGWVRNEADGSLRIHAQGESQAVDQLIRWCGRGPQFARVDQVTAWEEPEELNNSFEILH